MLYDQLYFFSAEPNAHKHRKKIKEKSKDEMENIFRHHRGFRIYAFRQVCVCAQESENAKSNKAMKVHEWKRDVRMKRTLKKVVNSETRNNVI